LGGIREEGNVQAPAMMISRIHFSGDMLARVDWTLLVKRWPIVEARLASSSIVGDEGFRSVMRGRSVVVKYQGFIDVRCWEKVGCRSCREEDGSELP